MSNGEERTGNIPIAFICKSFIDWYGARILRLWLDVYSGLGAIWTPWCHM